MCSIWFTNPFQEQNFTIVLLIVSTWRQRITIFRVLTKNSKLYRMFESRHVIFNKCYFQGAADLLEITEDDNSSTQSGSENSDSFASEKTLRSQPITFLILYLKK